MFKAEFQRVPPSDKTEPLQIGWVAVSHRFIDGKQIRRNAYGKVYKIKSKDGVIFRNIRFSPRLKGSKQQEKGQILLDWQGWINLSHIDNENGELELSITKANVFEVFYHSMTHPDPTYRHSMMLSRIGLYLGIISLIISFK